MNKVLEAFEKLKNWYVLKEANGNELLLRENEKEMLNLIKQAIVKAEENENYLDKYNALDSDFNRLVENRNHWMDKCDNNQKTIEKLSDEIRRLKDTNRRNEKKLKALEIVNKKNVKIDILKYNSAVIFYNMAVFEKEDELTKEEFDLLKEEFL